MKASEAIRKIFEKSELKFSELMDMLGVESNTLANRFKQDNLSVKKLDEMARVMKYKIVLVPRDTRMKSDWYEVE